jgi:hypothetical protein
LVRARTFFATLLLSAWYGLGTAHAEEVAPVAPTRAAARSAIVAGDLPRAREILSTTPNDVAAAERAALAELVYVVNFWSTSGRSPPSPQVGTSAPMPDPSVDWERAFTHARALLLVGRYAEAARRLDLLVGTAPDLIAGARAAELRALARDFAPNADSVAPPVVAAPPPSPSGEADTRPETESHWYGWQILICDGAAILTTPLLPPFGAAVYVLGGPIVHVAHLHGFSALGSLGLRVLAPPAGFILGALAGSGCNGEFCALGYGLIGGIVGLVGAIVIDTAVLAREDVPVEKKKQSSFVPLISTDRIGIAGTF